MQAGVNVAVDNLFCVKSWPTLLAGKDVCFCFVLMADSQIFLRIDPGQGRGHHHHVKTAGSGSKFGIAIDDVAECAKLCAAAGIRGGCSYNVSMVMGEVVGLHCHSGSGIFEHDAWISHAATLVGVAEQYFPSVRSEIS